MLLKAMHDLERCINTIESLENQLQHCDQETHDDLAYRLIEEKKTLVVLSRELIEKLKG